MRNRTALHLAGPATLFLALVPNGAAAQTRGEFEAVKGIDERFRLDLGGFLQNFSTTVRLDSQKLGAGTDVNLEEDLGLKAKQTNFRADGYWRFGRHGRVDFAYLGSNRTSSSVLQRDVQVGDQLFHVGSSVDSKLTVHVAELSYSYSLVDDPETEFGLMLGATTLFGSASVETQVSGESQSRSLVAPVAAVGAHFRYTLLPGFLFTARVKGFGATIAKTKGSVLDWKVGLDYYPWTHVGLGAAWAQTDIKVTYTGDPSAQLEYRYNGPMGYLSFVF